MTQAPRAIQTIRAPRAIRGGIQVIPAPQALLMMITLMRAIISPRPTVRPLVTGVTTIGATALPRSTTTTTTTIVTVRTGTTRLTTGTIRLTTRTVTLTTGTEVGAITIRSSLPKVQVNGNTTLPIAETLLMEIATSRTGSAKLAIVLLVRA